MTEQLLHMPGALHSFSNISPLSEISLATTKNVHLSLLYPGIGAE